MIFLTVSLSTIAAAALIGELIRRGLRDGDRPGDVRVTLTSVVTPARANGAWAEIDIDNPGEQIALVGITTDRVLLGGASARTAAPPRSTRQLGPQQVGAVRPGACERFRIWVQPANRRATVIVIVGTPGRLRRHRLRLNAVPRSTDTQIPAAV